MDFDDLFQQFKKNNYDQPTKTDYEFIAFKMDLWLNCLPKILLCAAGCYACIYAYINVTYLLNKNYTNYR